MNVVKATIAGLAFCAASFGVATTVPKGTEVKLAFDQSLSSRTAKAGDKIHLHVTDDVVVNGKTIIKAGSHATAIVESVSKRDRFGKNARIRLVINPISDVNGKAVPVQPRQKGKQFSGSKTDKAAIASGAGAVLLGPVGLVGGYFVTGKSVNVKPGDPLDTEVARTTAG